MAIVVAAIAAPVQPAVAAPDCADAIIEDWAAGALDATYALDCYGAAIDALPEDLRAYTTAADDISRIAMTASRAEAPARQLASSESARPQTARDFPLIVAFLAAFVAALAASGLGASFVRRRRAR